ncbi:MULTISPECIES: hypothetical protein [unclassified Micromonospora]|uniref:hypothetical protein n=1 Tax=unclassified Micromonospora TaxID=2617518 RepID=UPI001C2435BD|nr:MULTISPECIES: hypothetical protein [unclassified Micromonospora]MBU8860955.1 hypothetical protein [Micromonospora sp. WMMB482]MDM4780498.1 hypothetical protein [Micromonospora sp. b486]
MELRRNRQTLSSGLAIFVIGVAPMLYLTPSSTVRWALVGLWLLAAGVFVAYQFRPFRFRIGADGLDLRVAGLNRMVAWAEIEAVVLDQPLPSGGRKQKAASVLLVPATASTIDRRLTGRDPADGRPALVLLNLDQVQQPPGEVAAALAHFGGSRFTDARQRAPQRPGALPDLDALGWLSDVTLRVQEALDSGDASQRQALKAEVDAALTRLSEEPAVSGQPRMDNVLKAMSDALGAEDEA